MIHTIQPELIIQSPVTNSWQSKHTDEPMKDSQMFYLVNKSTAMESSDLTPSYVWYLEVCVQQQVETERQILAGVVHSDVEMQLFLT